MRTWVRWALGAEEAGSRVCFRVPASGRGCVRGTRCPRAGGAWTEAGVLGERGRPLECHGPVWPQSQLLSHSCLWLTFPAAAATLLAVSDVLTSRGGQGAVCSSPDAVKRFLRYLPASLGADDVAAKFHVVSTDALVLSGYQSHCLCHGHTPTDPSCAGFPGHFCSARRPCGV